MIADTAGRLHEDAVRLPYHAATVKASGNVDNEGPIGCEQEDHRFGFRRATIMASGATRPNLDFFSPPSTRSSDTTPSTFPF